MKGFKRYEKYKSSGVEWLGEVPEHWEEFKPKTIGYLFGGLTGKSGDDFKIETETNIAPYIPFTNIANNFIIDKKKFAFVKTTENEKQNLVKKNDLLFLMSSENFEDIGKTSLLNDDVDTLYLNSFCKGFRIENTNFSPKFLNYIFSADVNRKRLSVEARGFTRINLKIGKVNDLSMFAPKSFVEQEKIANFLDYKTTKIDRFIRKKKQLLKLLNEQKAAIINDVVTKGLDGNVKMKSSGIEWLGDIPVNWEVKPLKYIGYSVLGKMLCNEDKGDYFKKPYLKSKNIQWLNVNVGNVEEMWFSEKELLQYKLNKGDLILSEGGEVGKTCIWNNELEECYIQNSAHKITFNNLNIPEFYLYLFFLYGKKGAFEANTNRVSIGHLTKDKLINLKCIVPPLSEQQKIVSYIETETAKLNKAIATIEKEIALVQEYKTALIAEAVTGKIDVRDYVIPVFEEETEMEVEREEELDLVEDGEEIE